MNHKEYVELARLIIREIFHEGYSSEQGVPSYEQQKLIDKLVLDVIGATPETGDIDEDLRQLRFRETQRQIVRGDE